MPDSSVTRYTVTAMREEHAGACCALEALAFNRLRDEWNQPWQPPRKVAWGLHHIRSSPRNNLVALADGKVIGFSMAHDWGSLGWLGPIVVDPQWQGLGLGRDLTVHSRLILEERGCQTIALETWPHFPRNVALYIKSGFAPVDLVAVLEKRGVQATVPFSGCWLSGAARPDRLLEALARLSGSLAPGLDYRRLLDYTLACQLGDVAIWGDADEPEAAAVVHFEPYSQAPTPPYASVELLMARPGSEAQLDAWLQQLEGIAASAGRADLRLSVPGRHADGLRHLVADGGWQVIKTRLRMASREQPVPGAAVNYLSLAI